MSPRPSRRIFYACGPSDIVSVYRSWRAGAPKHLSGLPIPYTVQFLDLCESKGVSALAISSCRRRAGFRDATFEVRNRPIPLARRRGALFHLGHLAYGVYLVSRALRFRADLAVVQGGTHWPVWSLLSRAGVAVVPTLHGTLWEPGSKPPVGQRFFLARSQALFASRCLAVLSNSPIAAAQVQQIAGGQSRPVLGFLPTYPPGSLAPTVPPQAPPFRILFSGRLERGKGVLELLEAARRMAAGGRTDVVFELCGDGSLLNGVTRAAADPELKGRLTCRGHCDGPELELALRRSHVVVARARGGSSEGLNKVTVEAILAGRPVIASQPAIVDSLRPATVEIEPGSVDDLCRAIDRLVSDPDYYESKRSATSGLADQVFEPAHSWGAALEKVLAAREAGQDPEGGFPPLGRVP